MAAKKRTAKRRPTPPEELDGEAVLEWDRICDELKALGRLDTTDRGIMTLHCQTWAINAAVTKHVIKFGAVIKWANGVAGPSPFYKTQKETTAILRGTLSDLGLTPASRGFKVEEEEEPDEL